MPITWLTKRHNDRSVCAATLTFDVAPFPLDSSGPVLSQVVLSVYAKNQKKQEEAVRIQLERQHNEAKPHALRRVSGWISHSWDKVQTFKKHREVKLRQVSFERWFSKELQSDEANSSPGARQLTMSAHCALLSFGIPHTGCLFCTSHGIFFASDGSMRDGKASRMSSSSTEQMTNLESIAEDEGALPEGRECIKEHIPLESVASLLPSILLPCTTVDSSAAKVAQGAVANFHIQGVPCAEVLPSALQVFCGPISRLHAQKDAITPPQIFQFVHFSEVVMGYPEDSICSSSDTIWSQRYGETLASLPSSYDTLKCCAHVFHLWKLDASCNRRPLQSKFVVYAPPH